MIKVITITLILFFASFASAQLVPTTTTYPVKPSWYDLIPDYLCKPDSFGYNPCEKELVEREQYGVQQIQYIMEYQQDSFQVLYVALQVIIFILAAMFGVSVVR